MKIIALVIWLSVLGQEDVTKKLFKPLYYNVFTTPYLRLVCHRDPSKKMSVYGKLARCKQKQVASANILLIAILSF
jgi:hypothetical protein